MKLNRLLLLRKALPSFREFLRVTVSKDGGAHLTTTLMFPVLPVLILFIMFSRIPFPIISSVIISSIIISPVIIPLIVISLVMTRCMSAGRLITVDLFRMTWRESIRIHNDDSAVIARISSRIRIRIPA